METYTLRFEDLLCQILPKVSGTRGVIAKNPYAEILKVLLDRVSTKELEKFKMYYQGIVGKNIATLQEENYDLEKLITDLSILIKGEN